MENFKISSYKFWKKKSILAVILRGQPTLYNRHFTRYGKSYNFNIKSPPPLPHLPPSLPKNKTIFRALPVVWWSF